jgi:hypothetical protein
MAGPKSKHKPKIHLIPSEVIIGMARGYEYGIIKHGRFNFRFNDVTQTEVADSLLRHTLAWLDGEDIDQESGLPHVWLIGANYGMLEWKRVHRPDLDDRYKGKKNAVKSKETKPRSGSSEVRKLRSERARFNRQRRNIKR